MLTFLPILPKDIIMTELNIIIRLSFRKSEFLTKFHEMKNFLLLFSFVLSAFAVVAQPTTAPPTPTEPAANVISMFSDAYADVPVDTWRTGWSGVDMAAPVDANYAGNDVKQYFGLTFVGIETVANQIDISGMNTIHMDIWTGNMTNFRIKLVDFGPTGGYSGPGGDGLGDDTEAEVSIANPNQNEWVSIAVGLQDFAALTNRNNIAQMILSGDPAGSSTVYVDNVYFSTVVTPTPMPAPMTAAPDPTIPAGNVISMFSNVYNDVPVDTWRTPWSHGPTTLTDIQIDGNDTKVYNDLGFVGIETVSNQIDATGMETFHMDIWTANAAEFKIKLVDFGPTGGFSGPGGDGLGDDTEHEITVFNPGLEQWVSLEIPLYEFAGLQNRANIAQLVLVGIPFGDVDIFIDNVYFSDKVIGPLAAAPNPNTPASDVISLFSNVYNDVPVDTWRTPWSHGPTALSEFQLFGNDVKYYNNLGFVGVETVSNTVDASGMNTFHFDIWTDNMNQIGIKLVDFGADGAFGGGNDTEFEIFLPVSAPGTWMSFDIPLSDFPGLASTEHMAQYIFSSDPFGTGTVFIDNVYFSNLTAPSMECRQPTVTTAEEGLCGVIDLTVLDPIVLDPSNVGGWNITSNAPFFYPVGTTTVTYFMTNADGSFSSCTQEVTIEDNTAPVFGACNTEVDYIGPNGCTALVQITADVTDDCGVVSITGTGSFTYPTGVHNHQVTATDANGNVTVHDVTIYVHDNELPEFAGCPNETISLTSTDGGPVSYPSSMMPTATDNCGVTDQFNNIPAGGLPVGDHTVVFSAADAYGNVGTCVVNVSVVDENELIELRPMGDIGASLAVDEGTQVVTWNAFDAATACAACEETALEGFTYVGTYFGHQYFLADENAITRQEAQLMAEGYDAHLAVINSAEENNYLKEALGDVRSAWIGLMPQQVDGEWALAWDNGDALDFDISDFETINEDTRIILSDDGNWITATDSEEKYFLMERPCVNFTQVSPVVQLEADEAPVMLRSGDAWPEGEYEVTYTAVDMCGNETELTFDVSVLPEVAEVCSTAGTDNSVWINNVIFHEMNNQSVANEGYADFTEEVTEMNIGDGVVLLNLTAGGNAEEETLYWRVWLDSNKDGDFYDAGEMLFEQSSANPVVQANIEIPQESLTEGRLRIAVAKYNFPAPCGDFNVGEIEDYAISLTANAQINVERIAEVNVYPDPADTNVNVDLRDFAGQSVMVRIIDNFGKTVLVQEYDASFDTTMNLNLRGVKTGMYNVAVQAGKTVAVKRLVVSRSNGRFFQSAK